MRTAVCALCAWSGYRKKRMRTTKRSHLRTFEVSLETYKVTDESIQQEVVVGPSKGSVDENACVDRRSQGIVGKRVGHVYQRLESIVPSDSVRAWIYPHEVPETSGCDLDVVIWITPATQSARFVVVEDCRMLSIGGVLRGTCQNMRCLREVDRGKYQESSPSTGSSRCNRTCPSTSFQNA